MHNGFVQSAHLAKSDERVTLTLSARPMHSGKAGCEPCLGFKKGSHEELTPPMYTYFIVGVYG